MSGRERRSIRLEPIYRVIATNVRAARISLKMTQADLARLVGLKRTSLVNIEAGAQRMMPHTLVDLARALDTDLVWLVTK